MSRATALRGAREPQQPVDIDGTVDRFREPCLMSRGQWAFRRGHQAQVALG